MSFCTVTDFQIIQDLVINLRNDFDDHQVKVQAGGKAMKDEVARLDASATIESIKEKLASLDATVSEMNENASSGDGRARRPYQERESQLDESKAFYNVDKLVGKDIDEWEKWRWKIQQFFSKVSGFVGFLKWVGEQKDDITEKHLTAFDEATKLDDSIKTSEYYNRQMWTCISQKTDGVAHCLIKGLDDSPNINGVRAWQQLKKEAEGQEDTARERPMIKSIIL